MLADPTPPAALTEALRRYDADLRVRWGRHRAIWLIERKLPPRHRTLLGERPSPWKSARGRDLYEGWREGYVHILSVHPDLIQNTPRILDELASADLWRQGGIEAINRRLDEVAEQEQRDVNQMIQDRAHVVAYDSVDRLAWLGGGGGAGAPPAGRATPGGACDGLGL